MTATTAALPLSYKCPSTLLVSSPHTTKVVSVNTFCLHIPRTYLLTIPIYPGFTFISLELWFSNSITSTFSKPILFPFTFISYVILFIYFIVEREGSRGGQFFRFILPLINLVPVLPLTLFLSSILWLCQNTISGFKICGYIFLYFLVEFQEVFAFLVNKPLSVL